MKMNSFMTLVTKPGDSEVILQGMCDHSVGFDDFVSKARVSGYQVVRAHHDIDEHSID